MRKSIVNGMLKNIVAWAVSLVAVAPLVLIVINSLKNSSQASSMGMDLPKSLHVDNFSIVFEKGKLALSLWNSMLYASVSTLLCVLLASMAAYVYSRRRTLVNRFSYLFVLLGLAMPLNYFTLMKTMQMLHLVNSQTGIIILYAAIQIPLSIFILYGFVGGLPKELDEAGTIDGCGPGMLFFRIILPLLKPAAVTVFILAFLNTWNEFLLPLYFLNSADQWPMTLSVYNFFGQFQMEWNLVSADIVMTSLPVVIVYLLGQRFIIAGMTAGSVKG